MEITGLNIIQFPMRKNLISLHLKSSEAIIGAYIAREVYKVNELENMQIGVTKDVPEDEHADMVTWIEIREVVLRMFMLHE